MRDKRLAFPSLSSFLLLLFFSLLCSSVHASVVYVRGNGTDSDKCGTMASPCSSLSYSIGRAAAEAGTSSAASVLLLSDVYAGSAGVVVRDATMEVDGRGFSLLCKEGVMQGIRLVRATFRLSNLHVANCAPQQGLLSGWNSIVTISGSIFRNCSFVSNGVYGGVIASVLGPRSRLSVSTSLFSVVSSSMGSGGVMWAGGYAVEVDDCVFNNTGTIHSASNLTEGGGAFMFSPLSPFTPAWLSSTDKEGVEADMQRGTNVWMNVTTSVFASTYAIPTDQATAGGGGGGILVTSTSNSGKIDMLTLTIRGCSFDRVKYDGLASSSALPGLPSTTGGAIGIALYGNTTDNATAKAVVSTNNTFKYADAFGSATVITDCSAVGGAIGISCAPYCANLTIDIKGDTYESANVAASATSGESVTAGGAIGILLERGVLTGTYHTDWRMVGAGSTRITISDCTFANTSVLSLNADAGANYGGAVGVIMCAGMFEGMQTCSVEVDATIINCIFKHAQVVSALGGGGAIGVSTGSYSPRSIRLRVLDSTINSGSVTLTKLGGGGGVMLGGPRAQTITYVRVEGCAFIRTHVTLEKGEIPDIMPFGGGAVLMRVSDQSNAGSSVVFEYKQNAHFAATLMSSQQLYPRDSIGGGGAVGIIDLGYTSSVNWTVTFDLNFFDQCEMLVLAPGGGGSIFMSFFRVASSAFTAAALTVIDVDITMTRNAYLDSAAAIMQFGGGGGVMMNFHGFQQADRVKALFVNNQYQRGGSFGGEGGGGALLMYADSCVNSSMDFNITGDITMQPRAAVVSRGGGGGYAFIMSISQFPLRLHLQDVLVAGSSTVAEFGGGGGMLVLMDNPTNHTQIHLSNCTFQYDQAITRSGSGGGGGVLVLVLEGRYSLTTMYDILDLHIVDTNFIGCYVESTETGTASGGGLSIVNLAVNVMLTKCKFHENVAFNGGAFFVSRVPTSGIASTVLLDGVSFYRNIADGLGGAVFFPSTVLSFAPFTATLGNCNFTSNLASEGAHIYGVNVGIRHIPSTTSTFYMTYTKNLVYLKNSNDQSIDVTGFDVVCPIGAQVAAEDTYASKGTTVLLSCSTCASGSFLLESGTSLNGLRCVSCFSGGAFLIENAVANRRLRGADCTGGGDDLRAVHGYWADVETLRQETNKSDVSDSITFYYCPLGQCCVNTSCSLGLTCAPHRSGRLCSQCDEGYGEVFLSGTCRRNAECNDGVWALPAVVVLALLYCILLLILPQSGGSGSFKIFTYYYQIVGLLLSPAEWGFLMARASALLSILSLSVAELNAQGSWQGVCLWPGMTQLGSIMLEFGLPVLLFLCLGIICGVHLSFVVILRTIGTKRAYAGQSWPRFVRDRIEAMLARHSVGGVGERGGEERESRVDTNTSVFESERSMNEVEKGEDGRAKSGGGGGRKGFLRESLRHHYSKALHAVRERYAGATFTILLVVYSTLVKTSFKLLQCEEIGGKSVLYHATDVECYQIWQKLLIVVVVLLLLPYPFYVAAYARRIRIRAAQIDFLRQEKRRLTKAKNKWKRARRITRVKSFLSRRISLMFGYGAKKEKGEEDGEGEGEGEEGDSQREESERGEGVARMKVDEVNGGENSSEEAPLCDKKSGHSDHVTGDGSGGREGAHPSPSSDIQLDGSGRGEEESEKNKLEFIPNFARTVMTRGLSDSDRAILAVYEGPFRDARRWWEVVLMLRRAVLIALYTLFFGSNGSVFTQALVMASACAVVVATHILLRPYRERRAQHSESVFLFFLLVISIIQIRRGVMVDEGIPAEAFATGPWTTALNYAQLVLLIIPAVFFVSLFLYRVCTAAMKRRRGKRRKREEEGFGLENRRKGRELNLR